MRTNRVRSSAVRFSVFALALVVLSNCASYPKGAAVTAFAAATVDATAVLQSAAKTELTLAQKLGYEAAATAYIKRSPSFKFPTRDYPLLKKANIAARIEVLKAIAGYASALAALNDPEQATKVGEAVSALGGSLATFAHLTGAAPEAAVVTPVIGTIGAGVTYFVSQRNAVLIRETARQAHPHIVQAARLLSHDFDILNGRFERRLEGVRDRQRKKLEYIRTDKMIDSVALEKRFYDAVTADQELAAQITAFQQSKDILTALVEAHEELQASEDTDRAIRAFKTFVEAIKLPSKGA